MREVALERRGATLLSPPGALLEPAAVAATAACFGSRRARCRGSFLAGCAVALELGEFLSLLVRLHMAHARSKRQGSGMDGADATMKRL